MPLPDDWTYGDDPANSDLDRVRLLIQDVDPKDKQLSDTVIAWLLDEQGNAVAAAIRAVTILEARYARLAQSRTIGDLSINYGDRSLRYREILKALTEQGAGGAAPVPSFGGGSIQGKQDVYNDLDRTGTRIRPGMDSPPFDYPYQTYSPGSR